MGACFIHLGHDIIHVELCRFLMQRGLLDVPMQPAAFSWTAVTPRIRTRHLCVAGFPVQWLSCGPSLHRFTIQAIDSGAQLPFSGPRSFQLLNDPVHTETTRLLPRGKVQESLQEILRDYSRNADAKT